MSSSVDGATLARMPSHHTGTRARCLDQTWRHGVAADAVEPVAARDRVAADLVPRARRVGVAEHRAVGVQLGHRRVADLELDRGAPASLAWIRSLTISVCAYIVTQRPPVRSRKSRWCRSPSNWR